MLVRPRLAVVAAACAVAVLVPVGIASAGTIATTPTGPTETTASPTDSASPTPSSTPSLEPTPEGTPSTPVESPSLPPLPTSSRTVVPAPSSTTPTPTPTPSAPDRVDVVDPNDGVAPAVGQVDEYLRISGVVDTLEQDVAGSRAALATAGLAVQRAAEAVLGASLDGWFARPACRGAGVARTSDCPSKV